MTRVQLGIVVLALVVGLAACATAAPTPTTAPPAPTVTAVIPTTAATSLPTTAVPTARATSLPVPTATSAAAPTQGVPANPGMALLNQRCTSCHTLDRIITQRKTAAEWRATVQRMVNANGAQVTPAEQEQIVAYLAEAYGR